MPTRSALGRLTVSSEQDAYDGLAAYTLTHGDPTFIHQHVVDAFAAQQADERTKPIKLTFGLVGLYLKIERNFTGRKVQLAHMKLARKKEPWPRFTLPVDRGAITAADVLTAPPGHERDKAIDAWCQSVWDAYHDSHEAVENLLVERHIIPR
jgi:hypothetical protein